MIDGPFQEDGLSLFWNISLETVKGLQYLVLDYPPPYFATVSLISIWSTLYVCLMKPKRFASMDVSSNQRGLQQIRSLLTISLRASIDRVCGLSLLQIRLHAQQIQIQMPSKYEYKCTLMLRSCDQCLGHCKTSIIQVSFDQNIFQLQSPPNFLMYCWGNYFTFVLTTMPGGYSDRVAIHTREDWWTPTYKCKYNNTKKKTFTINAKETQKKGSQTMYNIYVVLCLGLI